MSESISLNDVNRDTSRIKVKVAKAQTDGPSDEQEKLRRLAEPINLAATSSNSKGSEEWPAAVPLKGKQSDETIENLVSLFRDFLEAAPSRAVFNSTGPDTQRNNATVATRHKRFFGLAKSSPPETGLNNKYDYEQKYPRDKFGEEIADNGRVWLTYLDEAESFDRERVEGWKETADVLLIFAGLFSGVVTTFVSQASQSLQQDNTRVTASLVFEAVQILRAQFSGMPIRDVPNSTITPTSLFTPSTNAFLVNGLWFTSLAITLSTALFAVLAKQWLYYYLSSITGTPRQKAMARQLRFYGFELWKVGAIVDLLPILLHLAVGIFLTGIIILLFPLDIRVAWTILAITGITYMLYFISVILPIRYPECPYTTSLTIYAGIFFFVLRESLPWIKAISLKGVQVVWRIIIKSQNAWRTMYVQAARERISFNKLQRTIRRHLYPAQVLLRHKLLLISKLAHQIVKRLERLRPIVYGGTFPKFTNWREENIKTAVRNATSLDFEAIDWLYTTSQNRSVHRMIARCAAVHPIISRRLKRDICRTLRVTLEVSETNLVDLHYGLYLDLFVFRSYHWDLLRSIPGAVGTQLEEAEFRRYSRIAKNVARFQYEYDQIIVNIIQDGLLLPLGMWSCLFEGAENGPTLVTHILTQIEILFNWELQFTYKDLPSWKLVRFDNKELEWWKFDYLFRYFIGHEKPDYSSQEGSYKTRYLLLMAIYHNLTSDNPLITDKEQRQKSLQNLFESFGVWLDFSNHYDYFEYFNFFKEVFCVDSFWCESMTDGARHEAAYCLDELLESTLMITDMANRFRFTNRDYLSLVYQWHSRDLDSRLSMSTLPLLALLLLPQNRPHLSTILSDDPSAVSHFSKCLQNLSRYIDRYHGFVKTHIYSALMDLLKSVNHQSPLFTILYNSSVLVHVWTFMVVYELDTEKYSLLAKSKLDKHKLIELFAAMNEQAQSVTILSDHQSASRITGLRPFTPRGSPITCLEPESPIQPISDLGLSSGAHPVIWKSPKMKPKLPMQWEFNSRDGARKAFQTSVHKFGQLIGVLQPQLATTDQSAPVNEMLDIDHSTEERAQVPNPNEPKTFHTVAIRAKKAFGSIWPKTSAE